METLWSQGVTNSGVHFINQHTICLKAGNRIRFIHPTGEITTYQHKNQTDVVFAVHPVKPVFALAETNTECGSVTIVTYPEMGVKVLGRISSIEVLHLCFSHQNLLACVSSIKKNLLSIWDYVKSERICEAHLNFVCPDIFGFCVTNQHILVGATERYVYVWTLEPYGSHHHLSCRQTAVPRLDSGPGFYEEPEDNSPFELISKEEDPNLHVLPTEIISGVLTGSVDEFKNYLDSAKRVKVISFTWDDHGYAIFGCKTGHVFMVDPFTLSVGVVFNPRVHITSDDASENSLQLVRLKDGDVKTIIYVKQGLICGGNDGIIRQLDWSGINIGEFSVGIVAPSAKSTATPSSGFLDCIQRAAHSTVKVMGQGLSEKFKTARKNIEHLSVCPTYQKFAVLRESGIIQVLDVVFGQPIENEIKSCSLHDLTISHRVKTSHAPFTGIASIQLEEGPFFVTANTKGQVMLWFAKGGQQTSSLEFPSAATCLRSIPGMPLIVIGFESGLLVIVNCIDFANPRIVQMHQLFTSRIKDIFLDEGGDLLAVTGTDLRIYLVSTDPEKDFQPLGYIPYEETVDSVAFARSLSSNIYVIVIKEYKKDAKFTNVSFLTLSADVREDPSAHHYPLSYQLRDDSLSVMTFKILLPISGSYLTVVEPPEPEPPSASVEEEAHVGGVLDRTNSNQLRKPQHYVDEDTSQKEASIPRITLVSFTKNEAGDSALAIIDLSKEINDQASTYRQYARSAQQVGRPFSVVREHSMRVQPTLQARANRRRANLRSVSFEVLSTRVPRSSINLLTLARLRKDDKNDKKKESKPPITGVTSFSISSVTFNHPCMMMNSTHLPGIIITTSPAGSVALVKVDEFSARQIFSRQLMMYSNRFVLKAAVTQDFSILGAVMEDGVFHATDIKGKIPISEPTLLLAPEMAAQSKREALTQYRDNFSNLNNPNAPSKNHTNDIDAVEKGSDDVNKVFTEADVGSTQTWLDLQFANQHKKDVQALSPTKNRIIGDFIQLKEEMERMADMNDKLTDLEKVAITEFELDSEQRNAIAEETNEILERIRQKVAHEDLLKDFTHYTIKQQCWDNHEVKGRSLLAYDVPVEVPNYPLYTRTPEEARLLAQAKCRRRIEQTMSVYYRQQCEKILRKSSTKDTDKASSDEADDDEDVHRGNRVLLGGAAEKFGVSSKLLYSQLELFTIDQKTTQVTLIQDLMRKLKMKFNSLFDACLERKRLDIVNIAKRVMRINEILPELDSRFPLRSMAPYDLRPIEDPESLLKCEDDEVDVEKYLSPDDIDALEAARLAEEERLRLAKLDNWRERGLEDMMDGVLEVRREDQLKKDIPVPFFIQQGKQDHELTPDEKRIYREYLKACQDLEEEREKYRKYLEADMKKNEAFIDETKQNFNKAMLDLFQTYLKYEIGLKMENLKVAKMRSSILVARELLAKTTLFAERKALLEERGARLSDIVAQTKELVDNLQEGTELIAAEDRLMDKGFRKEFHDIHSPIYEIIHKAFKKRPKRLPMVSLVDVENEQEFAYRKSLMTSSRPEGPPADNDNPYLEALTHCRSLDTEWIALTRAVNEFDEINKMAEYGIDGAIWERLYKSRMRKVNKEMELKWATKRLDDTLSFLKRRENEMQNANQEAHSIGIERTEFAHTIFEAMTNLYVSIVMPQGQVEIEVESGRLVEDYNTCLLINRKQIEGLNATVLQLSSEKIKHMELIKSYKRRFKMLEWDLREMLMRYEDLVTRQKQIANFTITREIQRYLQNDDYDGMVSTEITNSERTYAQLKANHKRRLHAIERRIRYYSERQAGKIVTQNANLLKELEDLNTKVWEARHMYEQTPHATADVLRAEACYPSLLRKTYLDKLIKMQTRELKTLQSEVEKLRLKGFPDIPGDDV